MKETIFVLVSFWPQNSIHFFNPPSKKKKKEKKKRENDVDQVANNFMKKFWEKRVSLDWFANLIWAEPWDDAQY